MKKKHILIWIVFVITILSSWSCKQKKVIIDDQFSYAQSRIHDLQLSVYITAHAVRDLLKDEVGRREALSIFRCNGITKAYIEVYRSGLVVDEELLISARDYFLRNDIEVVGGIATVPGKDFGVKQEGKLGWFNWQNKKTQSDLKSVMKMSASIFDEFIVDDFLCTADTSEESKTAKGNNSWSRYRRELLTGLSTELFIKPAEGVNPGIKMIIKYPQWYDRFHLFGYDLSTQPELFDKVWVGTETRGQYTQRYGFVQPYEGFINYRWIKDISGEKIGGAWFDHGDCDKNDFIEQAYQSVLAGAKEIVIFNYYSFVNGHEGHHLLRRQFNQLADLANKIENSPVKGIKAYKPVNSDAGGDLYLLDFMGMLGIPTVPVHQYPSDSDVIFLPTQAAADINIVEKVKSSISKSSKIIFTSGFLANIEADELTSMAGLEKDIKVSPTVVYHIKADGKKFNIENGLDLECDIKTASAEVLLEAIFNNRPLPFLTKNLFKGTEVYTLNTHTFSQEDFDKVGEVLLCPKALGLLDLPNSWYNKIRDEFNSNFNFDLDGPSRIVIQPFGDNNYLLHNYNNSEEMVDLAFKESSISKLIDKFSEEEFLGKDGKFKINMKARSRLWLELR